MHRNLRLHLMDAFISTFLQKKGKQLTTTVRKLLSRCINSCVYPQLGIKGSWKHESHCKSVVLFLGIFPPGHMHQPENRCDMIWFIWQWIYTKCTMWSGYVWTALKVARERIDDTVLQDAKWQPTDYNIWNETGVSHDHKARTDPSLLLYINHPKSI